VNRSPLPKGVLYLLAALTVGCEHTEPFSTGAFTPEGPFSTAVPRQLTLNLGTDLFPVWKPDETGLFYSYERTDASQRDRCIAELPPGGGTRTLTLCTHASFSIDSIDALERPVVSDSLLVYLSSVGEQFALTPNHRELLVTRLDDLIHVDTIQKFPFVSPSTQIHDIPVHMAWLGDDALIYVAGRIDYVPPAPFEPPDTVVTGIEIARIDLNGGSPVVGIIPGTSLASSVQPTPDGKAIYYTVANSSAVYRMDLATTNVQTVHDFGVAGIARDVQVSGNRLVAIVGGDITFTNDPVLGPITRDFGGRLFSVDLTSGQETDITMPGRLHRYPALSPSGQRLVVESYVDLGGARPLPSADLWALEEP
jgi:hypothetical protein